MLQSGEPVPLFSLPVLDGAEHRFAPLLEGKPALLVFFETDCPTCLLTIPYLNRLAEQLEFDLLGISQDNADATRAFASQMQVRFPVLLDEGLQVTRQFDPVAVPTLFLIDRTGNVMRTMTAFDKAELNAMTADLRAQLQRAQFVLADAYDGAPPTKPGCSSRHLEPAPDGELDGELRAARILMPRKARAPSASNWRMTQTLASIACKPDSIRCRSYRPSARALNA